MAEHHLPPEPVDHHHHKGGKRGVHADDLSPAGGYGWWRGRPRYSYYYGGGGGPLRALCFAILVLLLAAGITLLVLYVVYRPSHPTFAVTSGAVLALYNATPATANAPAALAASFQFTLVLRNPSGRSAARYDRLAAYVAYRGEPVTAPAPMPPLAQDAGAAVEVAPVLGAGVAAPVPVAPGTAAAMATDVAYGVLPLLVVLLGRVRFVSGPFHRGWHSLYARCDLLLAVRKIGNAGDAAQQAPLLGEPNCNVDM
ncbi:hypothetical protein BS78_09G120100 [Paspalum vaginatum]|nr:hypothetical protein BS78_09G120100 [Paspalum vaginatum]